MRPPLKAARYKNSGGIPVTSTLVPNCDTGTVTVIKDKHKLHPQFTMMKTFLVCSVQFCLIVFCIAACLAESKEPKRSKLSSVYALTPSLRVGRRSESNWDPNTDIKRGIGKMVSFLRIGRSDSTNWMTEDNNYGAKRPGSNLGMWFGPRLGRVQKRNIDDDYTPWTYIILNGEGPISRQVHYTPRLAREPEEIFENLGSEEDSVLA